MARRTPGLITVEILGAIGQTVIAEKARPKKPGATALRLFPHLTLPIASDRGRILHGHRQSLRNETLWDDSWPPLYRPAV